jgi:hypothetical protein
MAFFPVASRLNSEEKQERDFSNWLQEFGNAVQDGVTMMYGACELKRMFREKGHGTSEIGSVYRVRAGAAGKARVFRMPLSPS